MEPQKIDAIIELVPGAKCSVNHEGDVRWFSDDLQQPTEEAIQTKLTELQAEYEANQYQRDRAEQYPSYADQLDTLYHQGLEGWKAEIKKVKDQFPKPE